MSYAPQPQPGAAAQFEGPVPAEALQRAVDETARRRGIYAEASAFLGVQDPKKLPAYLRNFWKAGKDQPPLTDQEIFQGIVIVARFHLEPAAREVTVTRGKDGRLLTIIGIDGWIKVLDRTDGYDGFEQELHFSDPEERNLVWVETRIYSKQRSKPATYRAYWREYEALGGRMKGLIPWHMLRIFSLRHAARLFTPLGGSVVTEEEAEWAGAHFLPPEPEPEPAPAARDFTSQMQRKRSRKRADAAPEPAPEADESTTAGELFDNGPEEPGEPRGPSASDNPF